jgi:hypothetical protein
MKTLTLNYTRSELDSIRGYKIVVRCNEDGRSYETRVAVERVDKRALDRAKLDEILASVLSRYSSALRERIGTDTSSISYVKSTTPSLRAECEKLSAELREMGFYAAKSAL